jgi:hypothetical protein
MQREVIDPSNGFAPRSPTNQAENFVDENQHVPDAALLVSKGYPGIQYTTVDPDQQFQNYLIVIVQVLAETDPMSPPSFNPRLTDDGKSLRLTVPCSNNLVDPNMLTHQNAAWMKDGAGYEVDRATRLAGLGPAVAELQTFLNNQNVEIMWNLPLAHKCGEIVGNYSITNFPTPKNCNGQRYYPVLVEFKLKLAEQKVQKRAIIKSSVWGAESDEDDESDNDDNDDSNEAFRTPARKRDISDVRTVSGGRSRSKK